MSLPDPASHRGEIRALTSLRGLAAITVVLQHFCTTAQLHADTWIPSLVPHGYMAVDFFFVLSGFIMSYTYVAGFEAMGMRAYLPFLWKRVARIVPLGWAMTALILLFGAIAAQWDRPWMFLNGPAMNDGLGTAVIINILHLQGFFNRYNLNDPSWSISVELAAYLLFPAFVALLIQAPRWVGAAFVVAGVALLARIASFGIDDGLNYRSAGFDLTRCLVEFGFGMVVYRIYRGGAALRAVGRDRWTWCVAATCLAMFCTRLDLLIALSFPPVVLAFALNRGVPSRLLASPIPYALGTISFSIYLVHHMFRLPELFLLERLHPAPLSLGEALVFALAGSLSVLPFATLAYYTIERPGRTTLNAMMRRLRSSRAPPVSVRGRLVP